MAASRGVGAEMEKMSVEQLKGIKEHSDAEVNLLQESLNNIRTATNRLDLASTALQDLSLRPQGKKMLVPLTASLYVPATLDDSHKVLVDVGTGYFIEKTMEQGKDYCERKINLLKSNYDQLLEVRQEFFSCTRNVEAAVIIYDALKVASKKKTIADEAGIVLQAKLKQLAPAS